MPVFRLLTLGAAALALALPAVAQAGTVTRDANAITYQASQGTVSEDVQVGLESAQAFVRSSAGAMLASAGCTQTEANRVDCPPTPAFVVRMLGSTDSVSGDAVTDAATLEVHGGAGADNIGGTPNADRLFGDEDADTMHGNSGGDVLDGGAGADYLYDESGDDQVIGGPGDDVWIAGLGRDTFSPGDGSDTVDYRERTAGVTITLDGQADDGEAGEGDNVGAEVESAIGGSGNDRIVGNNLGDRLLGGAGDDTIIGGAGEERVEGAEGNDTIDTRDGRYDSVDCGPGSDVVFADPDDGTENCEVAPDPDGDGYLAPADCAPNDKTIHPGAGEIVGNNVDEDCRDGALYLRVIAPTSYTVKRRAKQSQAQFARLVVSEIRAGDRIELRCTGGKQKGCPFSKKTVTGKAGKKTVNLVSLMKKRYLHRNAVLEIRVLRTNEIGRVQRLKITKGGVVKSELLCFNVGATKATRCS